MDAPRNYTVADAFALNDLTDELGRARLKFPVCEHTYAALLEELGELAQALIEHKGGRAPARNVRAEALQIACVAIRIGSEGDPAYRLAPSTNVHKATECLGRLACGRVEQLRALFPGNRYALARLARAVTKIGEYLMQEQRTWQVSALDSAVVHVIAWALRIATEGDAAFPYAAPDA